MTVPLRAALYLRVSTARQSLAVSRQTAQARPQHMDRHRPLPLPVTEAEIEVFERWFADLFDELFGARP